MWVPDRLIYRANADGSDARLVWKEDELDEWRCPLVSGTNCVLRRTEGHQKFIFYLLDPVIGKGRELARSSYAPTIYGDWALSPDAALAAIPNHDAQSPSIRLLRLDGTGSESEIKVRQASQLWGICWASDSKGFFAEARTATQHWLEYIQLSGEVHVLHETTGNTWGRAVAGREKAGFCRYDDGTQCLRMALALHLYGSYSADPVSIYRLVRPAFFAGLFTDFFAAFLVEIFWVGDFFAAVFFAASFARAFLGVLLMGTFFANGFGAFLAGVSASVTVATAPPTAVLTEPATSSAIARPYPTFSAAFSNIVFSAIFGSLMMFVCRYGL
jgi:hypothetical protein